MMQQITNETPEKLGVGGDNMLGELLLRLAGRSTGRMLTARRHVEILSEAIPFLDKPQQIIAKRRIARLESRWGPLVLQGQHRELSVDPNAKTHELSPTLRVATWLSKRRHSARYLFILHQAATYFYEGGNCLSNAQDYAFRKELDGIIADVGLSSFTEWMIELRIAERTAARTYAAGPLCEWWVNEMAPTKAQDTAYNACLMLSCEIGLNKLRSRR